jgi:Vesicle coat protein involved in Golgi to plasma membrane transport
VLFGDAHNGYTIAYVFAIEDPDARGGKREGRRWYSFLAVFEEETEATGAWSWVTKGFENIARGLRERGAIVRRESSDPSAKADGGIAEDSEHESLLGQSISSEERTLSRPRARGSFGHPEGFMRRPRFGNPGGVVMATASTVKSLAELVGLDMVDVEIHAALGWIMSGLLGPMRK